MSGRRSVIKIIAESIHNMIKNMLYQLRGKGRIKKESVPMIPLEIIPYHRDKHFSFACKM
jgi:hypothetical protein